MKQDQLISEFKEKALGVSAIVHDAASLDDALKIALEICSQKNTCENLMPGINKPTDKKIACAPNLNPDKYSLFESMCDSQNICLIQEGVRNYPGGIEMGLTLMDYGIAETGTLVLASDLEDVRLSSMLCETHVAVLDCSDIKPTSLDLSDELEKMTGPASSYTAFITGASRTADIERVLAMGVHGPLELHIILTGE